MSQIFNGDSATSELFRMIFGASSSISLILPLMPVLEARTFLEFFEVLASRIQCRAIVPKSPVLQRTRQETRDADLVAELFRSANFEVRTPAVVPAETGIIVDDEALWFGEGNEWKDSSVFVESDLGLSYARSHFERLWELGDELRLLHEDFAALELPASRNPILACSNEMWDEVFERLSRDPEQLYALPPRKFEEMVAELLVRQGMEVHLTQQTRDGGYDMMAYQSSQVGRSLYLVECKRFRKERPVGVGIIRALYGVVEEKRATAGLIITTSRFTRDGLEKQTELQHRLALKDYESLCGWLKKYRI